jgi:hypothetical protein
MTDRGLVQAIFYDVGARGERIPPSLVPTAKKTSTLSCTVETPHMTDRLLKTRLWIPKDIADETHNPVTGVCGVARCEGIFSVVQNLQ